MTVKGMTKKQLIMLLEKNITNDNACVTESDMYKLFSECGDTYDVTISMRRDFDVEYKLVEENKQWDTFRPFLPRQGDVLKGFENEHSEADQEEH